jgi:hypothetical protein
MDHLSTAKTSKTAKRWPPGVKNRIGLFAVLVVFAVRSSLLSKSELGKEDIFRNAANDGNMAVETGWSEEK